MPTTKARINISISNSTKRILSRLAHRDEMPIATKAERLLEMAMELEEDYFWNKLAEERDTKGVKYLSHKQVWKNV